MGDPADERAPNIPNRIGEKLASTKRERAKSGLLQLKAEKPAAGSFEDDALLQLNILQTVVFSDHKYTHAVCKKLSRITSGFDWKVSALVSSFYGQATKGVR